MTSPTPSPTPSSQPPARSSTPSGNPSNKVDNLILSPRLGESIQYGQIYTIEWSATTSGTISVFYNSLLPKPLITPITKCQNIPNYPGAVNQCPWVAIPSPLPDVTNAGFEIVLVWNNTVEGGQVSPEFGVSNGSSSGASTASNPISASSTHSSTSATVTSQPNDMTQSKQIDLGVGLGIGILLLIILIAGCIFLWCRRTKKGTGASTGISPRNSNLPPAASRLERATRNPLTKSAGAATLLANYRNAEHFGFVPTPVDR